MSYAKYHSLRNPAEHLNSIFINRELQEQSNNPKYVRNTRKRRESSSSSDSESSSSSNSNCSSDSETPPIGSAQTVNLGKTISEKIDTNKSNAKKPNAKKANAKKANAKNYVESKKTRIDKAIKQPFLGFTEHIPKWGAKIELNGRKFNVTDTCSIDYFLFGFWIASKRPNFLRSIPELQKTEDLKRIIAYIEDLNWDKGREKWIENIIRDINGKTRGSISLFGSEYDRFITYLNEYQQFVMIQTCSSSCTENNTNILRFQSFDIYFHQTESNIMSFEMPFNQICNTCSNRRTVTMRFLNSPNFIFIQINGNGYINNIPKRINIDNTEYELLCATVHNRQLRHFYGIYNINDNFYVVDDLDQSVSLLENLEINQSIYFTYPATTCMYIKL